MRFAGTWKQYSANAISQQAPLLVVITVKGFHGAKIVSSGAAGQTGRDACLAKLSGLWETIGMKKPELIAVGWLGPRDEMDRASHRFGKCSECHEIICVEKAVADTQNTQAETNEMLDKTFGTHVKLKHAEDFR
jgi:hypothetical protein